MPDALPSTSRLGSADFPRSPAALIVNAHARTGKRSRDLLERELARAGLSFVTTQHLEDPAGVSRAVRAAVRRGAKLVVVGGGDGTISCAARELVHTRVALGILPLGTGNDFARGLGIPTRVRAAAEVLATGRLARVDVGMIGQRAFLNAASVGLSVNLTERLSPLAKRRLGKAAYPVAAVGAARALEPFEVELELEDRTERLRAYQVVVGNGRYHGAGLMVAPEATLEDRALDVYAICAAAQGAKAAGPARTLAGLARIASRLSRGTHVDHPLVRHFRTERFTLRTRPRLVLDVDGELAGRTPVTFSVAPAALSVVVPRPDSPGPARS